MSFNCAGAAQDAVLKEADIVPVCYDQRKYRAHGSGLAVEAIAFGKIVAKHMPKTVDGTPWATMVPRTCFAKIIGGDRK